jgi:hypothetical protein
MDEGFASVHAPAQGLAVAEVAADQLAAELGQAAGLVRTADQTGDLVAPLPQLTGDRAADEPRRACEEDLDRSSL